MPTGFKVKVICDSVSPCGVRATTVAARVPRVLLAELNTHRVLSRNAASNRAIPWAATAKAVRDRPYVPADLPGLPLRGNNAGMVAYEVMPDDAKLRGQRLYQFACQQALNAAGELEQLGWHKQDFNRLLEPFQWTKVVITSTEWDNFFALRTDFRAYPPFCFFARCLYVAMKMSSPAGLAYGQWHLPFIRSPEDYAAAVEVARTEPGVSDFPGGPSVGGLWYVLARRSSARCARVSYNHFGAKGGDLDGAKDDETYNKLVSEVPKHSSPLEHPMLCSRDMSPGRRSNARFPWVQFRKFVPGETAREFAPADDQVAAWQVPDDVFEGELHEW